MNPNPIPPTGNSNSKLLIIGEAPGEQEELRRENLVGPTGQLVQEDVTNAGLDWSDVLRTNIFPWRPPNNDFSKLEDTGHKLEEGIEIAQDLVRAVKPNAILTLGDHAFRYMTDKKGLFNYRGSILNHNRIPTIKVIPTPHPARLFKRDPATGKPAIPFWWRAVISFDIARAVKESRYSDWDLPRRNIRTITTTGEFHEFKQSLYNRKRRILALDIESHKTIPDCIALADSPTNCIVIPLLQIPYAINQPKIDIREQACLIKMLAELLADPSVLVVGQNIMYDSYELLTTYGIKIANIFADIMVLFHILYPELPKDLGFITSFLTREPFYKSEGYEFQFRKHPISQRYIYNGKDSCVTYEAFVGLEKEIIEIDKWEFAQELTELIPIYIDMFQKGFKGDLKKRNKLFLKYELLRVNAEEELFTLAGGEVNIRSTAHEVPGVRKEGQLPKLLKAFGFPDRASYNEESLTALYAHHAKSEIQKRVIDLVLSLRGIYGTNSKYLNQNPDWDNNYRTIINPFAAETGRASTQIPGNKNPYRLEPVSLSFHSIVKRGGFGYDVRQMLSCDEDEYIVEIDLATAEPRIVAHLSDDYDLLQMFEKGLDIHKWTAKLCLDLQKEDKDIRKDERFIGKTCRNAGNLGAKYKRFAETINTDAKKYNILGPDGYPIRVTESESSLILKRFHRFSPRVQAIFHNGTIEALERNNYKLQNPFGRPREFMGRRRDEGTYKEAFAFMASSPVSDHIKFCVRTINRISINERWDRFFIILDYHDALVFRIGRERLNEYAPRIKEIMETPIDFARCSIPRGKLRIPVEIKYGSNYGELEDYKVT